MIPRGLEGALNLAPIKPRILSLSDGRCQFFQFGRVKPLPKSMPLSSYKKTCASRYEGAAMISPETFQTIFQCLPDEFNKLGSGWRSSGCFSGCFSGWRQESPLQWPMIKTPPGLGYVSARSFEMLTPPCTIGAWLRAPLKLPGSILPWYTGGP